MAKAKTEEESSVTLIKVKIDQAVRMVIKTIQVGLVPMIHGSPAIGKSGIVHQIAEQFNLYLIDLRLSQCDPTDLMGFPQINAAIGRAGYVPMDTFPIEGEAMPIKQQGIYIGNTLPDGSIATEKDVVPTTYYAGWILFLDEFNSASVAVQAASYKVVLDRMVGKHRLHKNCAVVCAGNLETDGAIVEQMSTALQSRIVHMELEVCPLQWVKWAVTKGNIDHTIISFMGYKPGLVYTFKPDHSDRTYASPRTWEFANRFVKANDIKDPDMLPLLSGTITEGVTREFMVFCDIYQHLPTITDLVAAPKHVQIPTEPSVNFALTGMIAHHIVPANATPLMEYVGRMAVEFQVVCLRMIMARKPDLVNNAAVQNWVANNATSLY